MSVNKCTQPYEAVNSCHPDIVCVTETWFKAKHADALFTVPGYTCVRRDRSKRKGGGICLYIRHPLQFVNIDVHDANANVETPVGASYVRI